MIIDELWKALAGHGVTVPDAVQRQIGRDFNQERVFIRPPAMSQAKARIVAAGTSMSPEVIARQVGVTVQYVRTVRRILRGNNSS